MKKTIYLDTTVLSYLFDKRIEIKTYIDVTVKWWQTQRKNYDIFLSEETLVELKRGNYPNKIKILDEAAKLEVFYKIDFLLTWNCNHLANANKKQHIRVINTKLGLSTPEIITPLELFEETENDY